MWMHLPQENTLTEFRGDCFHGVTGFTSARAKEPRISLVLEQFRVPKEMYNVTWDWSVGTSVTRFPLDSLRERPAYYLLDEVQRRHLQKISKA
jgi:hypothetical protein